MNFFILRYYFSINQTKHQNFCQQNNKQMQERIDDMFIRACQSGDVIALERALLLGPDPLWIDFGMYAACVHGYSRVIDGIIAYDDSIHVLDAGLHGACSAGRFEIASRMLELGATAMVQGLFIACEGGHRAIVSMLIDRGVDVSSRAMYAAGSGGHCDIIDLLFECGAIDLSHALCGACDGDRDGDYCDLIDTLIARIDREDSETWHSFVELFDVACAC